MGSGRQAPWVTLRTMMSCTWVGDVAGIQGVGKPRPLMPPIARHAHYPDHGAHL